MSFLGSNTGRIWLPCDCESARTLLLKLLAFHHESAKAAFNGRKFVKHHQEKIVIVERSLDMLEEYEK